MTVLFMLVSIPKKLQNFQFSIARTKKFWGIKILVTVNDCQFCDYFLFLRKYINQHLYVLFISSIVFSGAQNSQAYCLNLVNIVDCLNSTLFIFFKLRIVGILLQYMGKNIQFKPESPQFYSNENNPTYQLSLFTQRSIILLPYYFTSNRFQEIRFSFSLCFFTEGLLNPKSHRQKFKIYYSIALKIEFFSFYVINRKCYTEMAKQKSTL